jgi:hypothetical protein
MRILVPVIVALIAFTFGCAPKVDTEAEMTALQTTLDTYVNSVVNEDMEMYAENVGHGADMMNFGAFGNPIVGWDALKQVMEGQNAGLEGTKITVDDMRIHLAPTGFFAWATCLWDFSAMMGDQELNLPVRCTWVLEKEGEDWKVIHFHKSVPAG